MRLAIAALLLVTGCPRLPSGVDRWELDRLDKQDHQKRDSHRPEANFDRQVVFLYLRSKGRHNLEHAPREYTDGDCTKAPDSEMRSFCEGRYRDLKDPDLVWLGYGWGTFNRCGYIRDTDLQLFCKATLESDRSLWFLCNDIKDPTMMALCDQRQRTFADYCWWRTDAPRPTEFQECNFGSGDTATSQPTQTEQPASTSTACKHKGQAVASPDECCQHQAEFNPNATDAQRRDGRDKRCSL